MDVPVFAIAEWATLPGVVALCSETYRGGWLEGLSQNPQNIYQK